METYQRLFEKKKKKEEDDIDIYVLREIYNEQMNYGTVSHSCIWPKTEIPMRWNNNGYPKMDASYACFGIHISNVTTKATRTLGLFRTSLKINSTSVKEWAYKATIRPILEYSCSVWDPYTVRYIRRQVWRRSAR